ncbi:MAG: hypothetical protein LBK74_03265 [Treponema sp.]|jgi:hypothetical protein|nr:hypothetical protein [Treponema sp.]
MMKQRICIDRRWQLSGPRNDGWLEISSMPMGVHEILHEKKIIGDDFLTGEGETFKWVAEQDWVYRCTFEAPAGCASDSQTYLYFETLDTIVSIYLNGAEIAQGNDMYLPLRADVSGKIKKENILELRFSSPYEYIKKYAPPPEWKGKVNKWRILRKPGADFSNYLGAQPYITLVGVFGKVWLEIIDYAELTRVDAEPLLSNGYYMGAAVITAEATATKDTYIRAVFSDPEGGELGSFEAPFANGKAQGSVPVNGPRLWWPRGYGGQPLYTIEVELRREGSGRILDRCKKILGFRELKTDINFDLSVNGRKIRLWGANLAPLDGKTRRWNGERARRQLDLLEMANMNTLRVWGPGGEYDDELYDECDKRGILVWQEFHDDYGMEPDSSAYQDLCRREIEHTLRRLKHHPCIFMWCGGNEMIMGADFDHPGETIIGKDLYTKIAPALCAQLDPGRFYLPTSPYGGSFANDPREGDCHGYEMWWYIPGMEYPVACTEQMRVSGPALKSMRRWIPEDKLWDDSFIDAAYPSKRQKDLMPPAWFHRVANSLDIKAGPVQEFRDADNPYELAFKYAAAHAKAFKNGIKRSRMGRPSWSGKPRISNAHLIWKLADTWPLIYSAIIDYYLEPFIPYYEAKRSYAPVMCCFDIRDSITLWLVNDSPADVSGTMEYGLFSLGRNSYGEKRTIKAGMSSGRSGEIVSLDDFGQFRLENILYARFTDEKNGIDYVNIDYVDIDRRLVFPEAKLELSVKGNALSVQSDQFARCVELEGNDKGDEFGFYFEDNYFDLLPGIVKRIPIHGTHHSGLIGAKAHYSPYVTTLQWRET